MWRKQTEDTLLPHQVEDVQQYLNVITLINLKGDIMPDNTIVHLDKFVNPCNICGEVDSCESCTYFRPQITFEDIQLNDALSMEASYEGAINAGMSEPHASYLVYGKSIH